MASMDMKQTLQDVCDFTADDLSKNQQNELTKSQR